ncbi:MAG TPA: zinc ABC transporter substrate-binding protein, partial [Allocoleopsis sp.]
NVMVPPGAEPHTFEPRPAQLRALSRADVYLRIRIEFEDAWMNKIRATNPRMLIVDTTEGIQRLPMSTSQENTGDRANRRQQGNRENLDPHIWLAPSLVRIQAQTIYNTLVQLDRQHQAAYQANLEGFLTDIDTLDQEIRQSLRSVKNRKFIVFHPGWGYFAREYGLEMMPIEVGGQEPSAAELAHLIAQAKQENIQVVFAEPQFSQHTAETIAKEIGGEVLLIDPLSPDWLNNLHQVAKTFSKVLSQTETLYFGAMLQIETQLFGVSTLKPWVINA